MKPLLIGLSGKAGSGKSTVGDYLEGAHGYEQFAFADALKEVVALAFGFTEEQLTLGKEKVDPRWGVSPRWCLQWLGTEVFRACWPDIWIRHLRQEILDFLSLNGQRPIVVTDVRFKDEAEALKRMGAVLVRIERPGFDKFVDCCVEVCQKTIPGFISPASMVQPGSIVYLKPGERYPGDICFTGISDHLSEVDLDGWEGWDYVIDNDGSLQDLAVKVEEVLGLAGRAELGKAAG